MQSVSLPCLLASGNNCKKTPKPHESRSLPIPLGLVGGMGMYVQVQRWPHHSPA